MESLKRWWPLVAILALAFNLRPVAVAIGPVLAEISADIGLDGVTAGLLTSLPTLCFAAFGALAPWVSQRIGVVPTVGLALAALLAGQVGRLLTHSPGPFLALSALALAGMALANVLMPTLVRLHYPHRVGTATALYSLTLTLGVTMASAATVPIAQQLGGWRAALGVWIAGGLAALVVWAPLLLAGARGATAKGARVSLGRVARTPLGWALAIFFGIQSAQAYSIFGWLPSVYRSAGLSEIDAGYMLGIATGVGILPAFVVPVLAARLRHPSRLFLTIMAFLVAGYVGLMLAPSSTPWLWAALLALGQASFPLILALFGIRARTPGATAALSGFAQSVGYAIAALGPMSFGVLHGATGSWTASISLQLALCVPMVVAGLYACRPLLIEDQLERVG
ncbi:MAG TPA: MFS transporter [Arachnia sp.]|nr:MFS transporter [Propionibacteriaceae bacterium]HOA27696.1 MFS transporter [Arachnia sp.]HQD22061.1 MFS transporter [Arachnia sp.]